MMQIRLFQEDVDRFLQDGTGSSPSLIANPHLNAPAIIAHSLGLPAKALAGLLSTADRFTASNPYRLWSRQEGLSFQQMKFLRDRIDISGCAPSLETLVLAVLGIAEEAGQSFCDLRDLCCKVAAHGACHIREAATAVGKLIREGDLTEFSWLGIRRIALTRHFRQEQRLKTALSDRLRAMSPATDTEIGLAAAGAGIKLHEEQADAVRLALENRVCIIQGGPGTGKTTILKTIVEALARRGEAKDPLCVALPARIARMVHDRIGIAAETIHRALEYSDEGFTRNAAFPIDADLVIVEEAFMIGNDLLDHLIKAIRLDARIIFIGDPEQIEPIGLGKPLEALAARDLLPTTRLEHNHRSGAGSTIPKSGRLVMKGKRPIFGADLALRQTLTAAQSVRDAVVLYHSLTQLMGEGNVQILTARHNGLVGTKAINDAVTERTGFAVGDRIMQLRNDAAQDFFNGETGEIVHLDKTSMTIITDGGATVVYPIRKTGHLAKAHCITYHKAQGLEYDAVVMIVDPESKTMINRNLINVGITRARHKCAIIDQRGALQKGLLVRANDNRRTTIGCLP